jgi:hypothetical protein
LYVHDERETLYFNADDFAAQPKKGDLVEITGKARGTNVLENPKLAILGQTALPAARPLELSGLWAEHGEWVEVRGRVLSAESSRGRLALLLNDKGQNCLVYLLGGAATNDFKQWLNCRVRVRGINASRMAGGRLESGLLFAPGPDEIQIVGPAGAKPSQIPVVSIGSLLNRELGSWTNQWVHINGLIVSYRPGQSITVKDPTGVIRARVIQLTEIRGDERVDVWGFLEAGPGETLLNNSYFARAAFQGGAASVRSDPSVGHPAIAARRGLPTTGRSVARRHHLRRSGVAQRLFAGPGRGDLCGPGPRPEKYPIRPMG